MNSNLSFLEIIDFDKSVDEDSFNNINLLGNLLYIK
jgi:hypothetical protein